jgi:hypothetical protein
MSENGPDYAKLMAGATDPTSIDIRAMGDAWRHQSAARQLQADKDAAYEERNRVVALLASLFPSGIARTDIPGWDPEWHGCVYIDLPNGQASWHYHDSQAHLFAHLPPYSKPWDGHTTEQKYERLAALATNAEPTKLWLWKNGDHFWAFRHLYPCHMDGGDPQTLGEPFGYALLKPSAAPADGPHKGDKP